MSKSNVSAVSAFAVLALMLMVLPHKSTAGPTRPPAPSPAHSPMGPPRYEAVKLGLPPGMDGAMYCIASPSARYVAILGVANGLKISRALLWKKSDDHFHGAFIATETNKGIADAALRSVNDAGIVVGDHLDARAFTRDAVTWNPNTHTVTKLFPDDLGSTADKIDNDGNIYGTRREKNSKFSRAYRRDPKGNVTYFDTNTERRSKFLDRNQRGQILLDIGTDMEHPHIVLWENNHIRDINTIPAEAANVLPGHPCGTPYIMGEDGRMLGFGTTKDSGGHPTLGVLLWEKGKPELIKTPNLFAPEPVGITRGGDVIGYGATEEHAIRMAALHSPFVIRNGKFYNIHDLLGKSAPTIRFDTETDQLTSNGVIFGLGSDSKPWMLVPK